MRFSDIKNMIAQRRQRHSLYRTAAYWDYKARHFDGHAVSMWPNNHLNSLYEAEQLDMLRKTLPALAGLRVLDAGCGIGRMSRWLARRGAVVTGTDFSTETLAIARQYSSEGSVDYRCESLFALDESEVYDLVFCWSVLTVACRDRGELVTVLHHLRAALKPDGHLFLVEPIHRGPLHRVLNLSLAEFTAAMGEVGLTVKEIHRLHFWPVRVVLAYLPWPRFVTVPGYWLGQALMRLPGLNRLGDYTAVLAIRNDERR